MRKTKAKDRKRVPDPKFGDSTVTLFVNNLMLQGKKSLAFRIFYDAIDIVEERTQENGLEVWRKSLSNVTPAVEARSRRVGGSTFQIPQEVRQSRKLSLGMKWMISFARKRSGKSMSQKLADEIVAGYKEEGGAFKRKEDTHRMAEANKAFSHFRF